ncbi:response regulator [Paenibacillus sp. NPDC056579]|uniref:response regulator n=1 Tax=Paenibacillus sp. NPDC056579 TaxID=3345871 RepID=UPI003697142F
MKAIIVDDEKHVREAVKLLVDWQHFHIDTILEAQDGEEAIALITEHRPQIIFTDMMMPVKSGPELLEWLDRHYACGKTIVISGHDDFQLLRHTVKHGGVDYILKPIDADQLHDAVEKAIEAWHREENERNRQLQSNIEMNQIRPVYWEKILSNLVTEPSAYEQSALALAQEFGMDRSVNQCRLAVISMDTMNKELKQKFEANSDLLFFSLTNICNEILRGTRSGVAFRYMNTEGEILILLYGASEPLTVLREIQRGLAAALRASFDIGLSDTRPFPTGLPSAYKEAKSALRRRNLLAKDKQIYQTANTPPAVQPMLSFSDYAEQIRLAVQSGSPEQIAKAAEGWINAVRTLEIITPEQLELWWNEYHVVRNRWLVDWFGDRQPELKSLLNASSPLAIPSDDGGSLSINQWQKELTEGLTELSKHLLKHQHQDNNVIYEIAKYIQNHYHQDITLQEIANHFYLSREYISRKFKQEFKVNLSDYLSDIRVEKAKLLLLNPNLRIAQVAGMVGYDDEKYFSKVFKKMVGLSPNEYRKVNQP